MSASEDLDLDGGVSMEGIPGALPAGESLPLPGMLAPVANVKEIICSLPKFDELSRECKVCLFQDNFIGGKVDLQKPHSNNFATTHSLLLSPPGEPSEYTFGANFFDSKLLMMGNVKNSCDMNCNVRYEFTKRMSCWFRSQMENVCDKKQINLKPYIPMTKFGGPGMDFIRMDIDYKGVNHVGNFNIQRVHHGVAPNQHGELTPLVKTDVDDRTVDESVKIYQGQYNHLHSITSDLSFGGSLTGIYQFRGTPRQHLDGARHIDWMASMGLRYDPKSFVLTASVNRSPNRNQDNGDTSAHSLAKRFWLGSALSFKTDYAHKVVDKEAQGGNSIWLAADYEVDPDPAGFGDGDTWAPTSSGSIGYMISLASNGMLQSSIKGKLTTEGAVSATVEEKLNQAVTLVLSASLDHATADYKFGFGMQVGGGI